MAEKEIGKTIFELLGIACVAYGAAKFDQNHAAGILLMGSGAIFWLIKEKPPTTPIK